MIRGAYSKDDRASDKASDSGNHMVYLDFSLSISQQHSGQILFNFASYIVDHKPDKHKDYNSKGALLCILMVNFYNAQSTDC